MRTAAEGEKKRHRSLDRDSFEGTVSGGTGSHRTRARPIAEYSRRKERPSSRDYGYNHNRRWDDRSRRPGPYEREHSDRRRHHQQEHSSDSRRRRVQDDQFDSKRWLPPAKEKRQEDKAERGRENTWESDDGGISDADDPRARRRRMVEQLRATNEEDKEAGSRIRMEETSVWKRMEQERELEEQLRETRRTQHMGSTPEGKANGEDMDISESDNDDPKVQASGMEVTAESLVMQQLMGITSFDTTKNKPHEDAAIVEGVRRKTKRKYRQYMNRKGGFNRPLSPVF